MIFAYLLLMALYLGVKFIIECWYIVLPCVILWIWWGATKERRLLAKQIEHERAALRKAQAEMKRQAAEAKRRIINM